MDTDTLAPDALAVALELADRASRQWVDVPAVIADVALHAGSTIHDVRRAVDGLGLAQLRPVRAVLDDGAALDLDADGPGDLRVPDVAAYLLADADDRRHAPDSLRRLADGAFVAWPVPVLVHWLQRVGCASLTPWNWREWMEHEHRTLVAAGLGVVGFEDATGDGGRSMSTSGRTVVADAAMLAGSWMSAARRERAGRR